ncbi:MAG: N-acetylmuramoyl-L-alanine amidase [Oscillospiraceae bacterium]|nr:N-acetylmuramoyl-L-alanine amidase [Oscillospiraceae bacterium]
MPKVFLSPSTQEWNKYVNGGNEQQYMNLVADAMEPYLRSSGIVFSRNDPDRNVSGAIADSNAGSYDVHLALHSNAGGGQYAGVSRGIEIYYSPFSEFSRRLAVIIANNMKAIYPLPEKAVTIATTSLGEVTQTRSVSVLCELGFHDNYQDAEWIKANIENMARVLVQSLCDYFGIPFIEASEPRTGRVNAGGSNLNIRRFPAMTAQVIGTIPDGAAVTVYGKTGNWYVVGYNGIVGYASAEFVS